MIQLYTWGTPTGKSFDYAGRVGLLMKFSRSISPTAIIQPNFWRQPNIRFRDVTPTGRVAAIHFFE